MGGSRARGTRAWACRTLLLLLLLLLLWGAAAPAPALEGDPASLDSHVQEVAEIKKNNLLTFLARWHAWTSHSSPGDLAGGAAGEPGKGQEGAPLQQPPRRDQTRCKNFFWKTFSSCK
uniref:Cortistatin n=1 Tax=Chinchilla lanigera TaxID=34839 RepID=A0A8C2V6D0_CHILA